MTSLWETTIGEDPLGMHSVSPRKYNFRTKRLSGCHHKNLVHFQRRSSEASPMTTIISAATNSNNMIGDFSNHYHLYHSSHPYHSGHNINNNNNNITNNNQNSHSNHSSHWVLSSNSFTFPASTHINSSNTTHTTSATGRYLLSNNRRSERRASASSSQMSPVSSSSPSNFHLGVSKPHHHSSTLQSSSPLPLPPMIDRCGLAGSPFLPASRDDAYDAMMNMALSLAVTRGAGHQGVKGQSRVGGDGGNGNGHDSESNTSPLSSSENRPVPASLVSTGVSKGDEDEDNDEDCDDSAPCPREPSSYTFRRRNAIVEWSEDAPKPNAYSSFCSSSSE